MRLLLNLAFLYSFWTSNEHCTDMLTMYSMHLIL